MPNLTQYQIAPPPTKVEYEAKVGSTSMGTTATTLTGAINEIKTSVDSRAKYYFNGYIDTITIPQSNFALALVLDGTGGVKLIQSGNASTITNTYNLHGGALTYTVTRANSQTTIKLNAKQSIFILYV